MQSPSAGEKSSANSLPTRRDAIKVASVVVGGALAGVGGGMLIARSDDIQTGAWHFFTPDEARLVEAISEQIIPADKDPGAKDAGVVVFIDRQLVGPYTSYQMAYRDGLRALQETCRRQFDKPFDALGWNDQTKVLALLEAGRAQKNFGSRPRATSSSIWCWSTPSRVSMEARRMAVIATTSATRCSVWTVLTGQVRIEVQAASGNFSRNSRVPNRHVNAIVVGSGAGGGVVAKELAVTGLSVVLFERGRWIPYEQHGDNELISQRTTCLGNGYGPDDQRYRRVVVESNGSTRIVLPSDGAYNNVAACVGSGTVCYGAMAWRFMPQDFKLRSTYGSLEGSTVEDWPISYDDLEPCYEKAEWEVGVSGDDSQNPFAPPRKKPQPMPAFPYNTEAEILEAAAKRLGWHPFPIPMLRNSVPYGGRRGVHPHAMTASASPARSMPRTARRTP